MNMQTQIVHWSMPEWAADLILKAITGGIKSPGFDENTRDALVVAAKAIKRNVTRPVHSEGSGSFDLFRLSKSKSAVDICPNTLRSYNKQGLPFYHRGKAVFVSKSELAAFIVHARHRKHGREASP
jgi:hypothetical protein